MKKLLALVTLILVLPVAAYAAPISWDFASGVLQPLQSAWGAVVKADHFQATSTTPSIFPNASTTVTSAVTLCLSADCRTVWPTGGSGTIATSSPLLSGQSVYATGPSTIASVATSTPSLGSGLSYSGTLGNFVNGLSGTLTNTGVLSFNTRTGAVTLSSGDVTGALGFTPYNSTNPSGYISNITGLVTAGTNVTLSGAGTGASPYVINATTGGSGSAFPFTPATNYGVNTSATTTPLWGQAGIFASSSTAYPTLAVGQAGSGPAATFVGGLVSIGSTSPPANPSLYIESNVNRQAGNIAGVVAQNYSAGSNAAADFLLENNSGFTGFMQVNSGTNSTYQGVNSFNIGSVHNISMGFVTNNALQATLNTTGLGLNNSNPAYKLDVGGDINFSQFGVIREAGTQLLYASSTTHGLFVGLGAGGSNATASSTIQNNTAVGDNALQSYTTAGENNVAVGYQSMFNTTSGFRNVGIGVNTLYTNTTGRDNMAIGFASLTSNTSGVQNVAIGFDSLMTNSTGNSNLAFGYRSLINSQTGASNLAIGTQAGEGVTTGSNNIQIGDSELTASFNAITTGSNNIQLGYQVAVPSATSNNQLDIGNIIYGTSIDGTGATLSSGNIGIGTTTPYSKFSVGGNLVVGASTAGGTLGDLFLPKLGTPAGAFIAVDPTGKVIATTTPSGGVTSAIAGSGISVSGATGAVTITNLHTAGTGLTLTTNAFNVNTTQNITTLSNLTVAGFVQTTSGGVLSSAALTSGQVTTALGFTPFGGTNPLPIANGGTATTTQVTNGLNFFNGTTITSSSTLVALSNGNVGIGTTSPASPLDLEGPFGTGGQLTIGSVSNGGDISFRRGSDGQIFGNVGYNGATAATIFQVRNNTGQGIVNIDTGSNTSSGGVTFSTNNIERGRFDFNGNFGVGTTSPFASLSVNGLAGGTIPVFDVATSTSGFATSTVFLIDQNGNVGVGSTTPGSLLSIGGNTSGTNFFNNATTTKSGTGGENIASGCYAINGVCLATGGSNFFTNSGASTFLSTGTNLGVGTSTPFGNISALNTSTSSTAVLTALYGENDLTYPVVQTFNSSGTWTRPANTVAVFVTSVGAGAGAGSATGQGTGGAGGGSTSFQATAKCTADGGGGGAGFDNGGSGNGGGTTGGTGGSQGSSNFSNSSGGGGGATETCSYTTAGAGSSVTVTVGKGGTAGGTTPNLGGTGLFAGGNGVGSGSGGAGGGGGGSTGAGGNAVTTTGGTGGAGASTGGTTTVGGSGGNGNSTATGGQTTLSPATAPGTAGAANTGAGGGGSNGAGIAGGAGADGVVIVTSYVTHGQTIATPAFFIGEYTNSFGNIEPGDGIGTTTLNAKFTVEAASSSNAVSFGGTIINQIAGTMIHYFWFVIDGVGHVHTNGPAPTVGTCSSITGDDQNMRVITGSSQTSCTIFWANAYTNKTPVCTATDESGGTTFADASSTPTGATLSFGSPLTSKTVAVHCEVSDSFTF